MNVKVILTYADEHIEEFTLYEDGTVTWTNGKPPGSMKLVNRERMVRLIGELITSLKGSTVTKFEMEENEE